MEDELLWANIDVIVEAHASGTGAEPPHSYAFTRCITKKVLRRTHDRVLELIKNGTLARGTLQLTMARVILGIVGVRPPTEHWALEKLGNWLKVILSREYLEPRSKLVRHKARNTARLQRRSTTSLSRSHGLAWRTLLALPSSFLIQCRCMRVTPADMPRRSSCNRCACVRACAHASACTHAHSWPACAPAGLMTPTTFEPCSGIGVGPPAAAA